MPKRFGYFEADPVLGVASALPYVPIMLQKGDRKVQVSALIDSGSTLNVLPFDVGVKLGVVWDEQVVPVRLSGNMAESEARGLVLTGQIEGFAPVRLAFAWSKSKMNKNGRSNRVGRRLSPPAPHTTWHAGPHQAVRQRLEVGSRSSVG
jgi:hypothetical protein